MRKTTLFGEYTAPELEVISTVVEQGFIMSASIDDAEETDYGTF